MPSRLRPAYIRLDVDMFKGRWLSVLNPESQLAWVKLLLTARDFKGCIPALEPATLARIWEVSESAVTNMLEAAVRSGALIQESGDSMVDCSKHYEVSNWNKYLPRGGA